MQAMLRRILGSLFVLGLAGVFAIGGLGFLGAALYMVLTTWLPPAGAAGACGLVGFVVAFVLLLVARGRGGDGDAGTSAGTPAGATPPAREPDAVLGDLVRTALPKLRRNAPAVAGGAFAVGLVLGVSPRARRGLWRLLGRALDNI
jgi:hypothetical protein